jgi:prevent-host-death family protein
MTTKGSATMLKRVSIREAKAEFSLLMKEVAGGAEVIVTNRGKAVGKIVPMEEEQPSLSRWITMMEREGIIEKPHSKKTKSLPPPLPDPEGMAQRFLEEDRNR